MPRTIREKRKNLRYFGTTTGGTCLWTKSSTTCTRWTTKSKAASIPSVLLLLYVVTTLIDYPPKIWLTDRSTHNGSTNPVLCPWLHMYIWAPYTKLRQQHLLHPLLWETKPNKIKSNHNHNHQNPTVSFSFIHEISSQQGRSWRWPSLAPSDLPARTSAWLSWVDSSAPGEADIYVIAEARETDSLDWTL